ncbi:hypothetical protein PHBOTO_004938 [Pseudozyma hubeiensis]|nr:hypothetical protein PHBOTO_004938 [Pseudozyma hubeiensis]
MVKWALAVTLLATFLASALAVSVTTAADGIKHVLVHEAQGYHDEVWAAFLADLGASPHIKTTFSRRNVRWNMPVITDTFTSVNPLTIVGFNTSKPQFSITPEKVIENKVDYILSISCDASIYFSPEEFQRLYHNTDVKLLCVNHDTHDMAGPVKQYHDVTKMWIDSDRITFLVLSEHVGKALQKQMLSRGSKPISYEVYIPVFDLPAGIETATAEDKQMQFVIQGNFETGRRDYGRAFDHFRKGLAALSPSAKKPKLVLIGSGKPLAIPSDLKGNVDMHLNLQYPEYYKTLGRSAALLPAFGQAAYYTNKASSTINAAIIGGVTIIGNQTMLDSYTFLDDRIVFKMQPGESDVQAAMRYLALDTATRNSRLKYIREYRHRIIKQNRELLEELINPQAAAAFRASHSAAGAFSEYVDRVKSVPTEHPRSSGAGFVVFIGLVVAFVFRRSLVMQARQMKYTYLGGRENYVPVSMARNEFSAPVMRSAA